MPRALYLAEVAAVDNGKEGVLRHSGGGAPRCGACKLLLVAHVLVGDILGERERNKGGVYSTRHAGALDNEAALLDKEDAGVGALSTQGDKVGRLAACNGREREGKPNGFRMEQENSHHRKLRQRGRYTDEVVVGAPEVYIVPESCACEERNQLPDRVGGSAEGRDGGLCGEDCRSGRGGIYKRAEEVG